MKFIRVMLGALAPLFFVGATLLKADDGLSALLDGPKTNPAPIPATQPPAFVQAISPQTALEKANADIQAEPNNAINYIVRGNIYGRERLWADAQKDYGKALALDPRNSAARLDLAVIEFRQKQYDQARTGFVPLAHDPDLGDLASYMIFLCDLFGAHAEQAARELAAFNAVGRDPSYYYANVAWYIYHHDPAHARGFLDSATRIYEPAKASLYTANLVELGYLPLTN
jgi:tetratricopeptide (TPR) repeat protein